MLMGDRKTVYLFMCSRFHVNLVVKILFRNAEVQM